MAVQVGGSTEGRQQNNPWLFVLALLATRVLILPLHSCCAQDAGCGLPIQVWADSTRQVHAALPVFVAAPLSSPPSPLAPPTSRTKLMDLMAAKEMARRLAGTGIEVKLQPRPWGGQASSYILPREGVTQTWLDVCCPGVPHAGRVRVCCAAVCTVVA